MPMLSRLVMSTPRVIRPSTGRLLPCLCLALLTAASALDALRHRDDLGRFAALKVHVDHARNSRPGPSSNDGVLRLAFTF